MIKKIALLTSGGDAPGMNAAIRAVVKTALKNDLEVIGIRRGYEGLLDQDFIEMKRGSVSDILQRGGTMLLTARSERFKTPQGLAAGAEILRKDRIGGLVVIGGNGSLCGAQKLNELGITTIGLPATIDNDLAYTEASIGFDTAINTALYALGNLRDTSYSHGRVNVVQVMGRHCGDIALHAAIGCGAEGVFLPEREPDIMGLCNIINKRRDLGCLLNIVVVAEGCPLSLEEIKAVLTKQTGAEVRTTVLGHIQRGGSPTSYDRLFASRLGAYAVDLLLKGASGRACGIKYGRLVDFSFEEALAIKKNLDESLYELFELLSK